MKIYLLEKSPEHTDSSIYYDIREWTSRGVSIVGNRNFYEHKSEEYERAEKAFCDFLEYYDENEKAEFLRDYFPNLSDVDGEKLIALFEKGERFHQIAAAVLTITTGGKYVSSCLRGCCQNEWQYIILPEEEEKNVNYFESMYFNTGTEYSIRQADDGEEVTPENFHNGEIYGEYLTEWNEEKMKKNIAEACGVNENDVIIFKIVSSYTAHRYSKA